ncbi:hypothetical protein mRhiFer1_008168 [Rhinolophus ferrumequinum]|uniref:Uncharacterized protein n=1 Tax=Rhinolophus ferrumequinum TaxID=59479 RepID=A0A7J7W863_RHIFE|nr:hypothetical protein mRhiFer1_008168 [Rhinolophus ferrumequinum]
MKCRKQGEEFLKLVDGQNEEEKEKLVDEMEKVKEMFMKEFKELTSKNSALDYQSSEIQKSNMQMKCNTGPLKDAHEFKEEEEEFDNVELIQACTSPNLFPVESSKGKSNFGRNSVKSDTDWTEGSKIEDSDISPKPTGTSIKTLTENIEKMVPSHRNVSKPAGGITVAEAFLKGEFKEELKCADGGDDD